MPDPEPSVVLFQPEIEDSTLELGVLLVRDREGTGQSKVQAEATRLAKEFNAALEGKGEKAAKDVLVAGGGLHSRSEWPRRPRCRPGDELMTFECWITELDDLCLAEFSLSIHDLPDMCLWDAYADGMTPKEFMADNLPDLETLGSLILS